LENNFKFEGLSKAKAIIQERIKLNKKYNYNLAITRDNIKLTNLILKEKLYQYFNKLANNWTKFDRKKLQSLNQEYKKYLKFVRYDKYLIIYQKSKYLKGNLDIEIKSEFEQLHKHYQFFSEFLNYIDEHKSLLRYKSLANFLKLGVLIDGINSNMYFSQINHYLRFIHTNMGQLILFLLIILLFFYLNVLLYKKIYGYFEKIIIKSKSSDDDILLENLNTIRKPISLLIVFIGLKLAFEVLIYPSSLFLGLVNIFYFIYLVLIVFIVFILIDNFLFLYITKKDYKNKTIRIELINLTITIIKIFVIFIGFLFLLVKLDIDISGILTSLGIGGLAVALASQTTLSNFFGLLKMILDKSFSQGDWIETADVEGTVVEIGLISTKIRTFDNALITIPNSNLANSSIKNWSDRKVGRRIKMIIGVTYDSNTHDLKNALVDITNMLKEHKDIVTPQKVDYKELSKKYKKEKNFVSIDDKYGIKSTLLVNLDKLSDSSVDILIYAFSKTTAWQGWLDVKQDVVFKVWDILKKHNLNFAYPSQSVYIENLKSDTL
jgi:MscS family membrane protein